VTTRAEMLEGAAMLRRLLAAVEAGELEADTPMGAVLRRHIEGAAAAWEEAARPRRRSEG